tara:strand:+ start:32725 stop:34857 length:2133 start_codon:yes stop_codon:yes gene_type:complete
MTVTSTKITAGPYAGTGVSDTFSYEFGIEDKSEIRVLETDVAGVQTTLTVDTDYTVNGVGNDEGTVTRLAGPLPSGYEWYIRSNYPETQNTEFESQGSFFPAIHEKAMDKLTRIVQQVRDTVTRSMRIPDDYSGPGTALLPEPKSGYLLRWLDNDFGFENVFPSDLSGVVTIDADLPKEFANVAGAVADATLTLNKRVNTKGYYTVDDGGDASYNVVNGGTGVDDGGSYINIDNGLQLQLITGGSVRVSQLGGSLGASAYPFNLVIIDKEITKTGTYAIQGGQTVEVQADIIQNDNLTCFSASSSSWQLIGNGEVRRSAGLPTGLIAGSIGISVASTCFLYRMTGNITFKHFSDIGVKMDGGGLIVGSVGRNTVSGITCTRNWDGMQLLDGFPAEYTSFSDCFLTDNVAKGLLLETGNINWVGGTIAGNLGGIHLRHPAGGGNPHHGMFLGANINHNTDYAIWAEQVANGQDFVGCHFYNNANPATGRIKLEDCRGINITGGTIGTNIEYINTGHIHVGYNRIAGNKMELANSGIEPTAGTFDRTKLLVEDNFSLAGRWAENDVANMEFLRWQGAATQVLTGATEFNLTALVGSVVSDNRSIFDGTNATVPYLVDLTIHVGLNLAASAAIVGGETLLIERDTLGTGVWQVLRNINMQPLANAAGTRFSIDATVHFQFTTGAKFRARLIGMTAGTSYTIAEGGYVSCTTAR